jgi:hypothetical protein
VLRTAQVFYQNFIAVGFIFIPTNMQVKKINFSKELECQQEERWFRNKKMCRLDYPGVFQTFRSPTTDRFSLMIIRTREELPGDWLLVVVVAVGIWKLEMKRAVSILHVHRKSSFAKLV